MLNKIRLGCAWAILLVLLWPLLQMFSVYVTQYSVDWSVCAWVLGGLLLSVFRYPHLVWRASLPPLNSTQRLLWILFALGLTLPLLLLGYALNVLYLGLLASTLLVWVLLALYHQQFATGWAILFSLFWIPVPPHLLVDPVTVQLKLWATQFAMHFVNGLHWPVMAEGNVIWVKQLALVVEAPCSGSNSLYSLTLLAVMLVGFKCLQYWQGGMIVGILSILAIALNGLRLVLTIAWALFVSEQTVFIAHEWIGWVTFSLGLFALWFMVERAARWNAKNGDVPT